MITSFIGLYEVELLDSAFTSFSFDLEMLFSMLQFHFRHFYYQLIKMECSHCSDQALKRTPIIEMLNLHLFFTWKEEI